MKRHDHCEQSGYMHCYRVCLCLKEEVEMSRKLSYLVAVVMIFAMACGSINRATPSSMDDTAMKTDVKGKILATDPGKTFDIGVEVHDGVVTLKGDVKNASDRDEIGRAANSVHGVKRVINNIQIKP